MLTSQWAAIDLSAYGNLMKEMNKCFPAKNEATERL